MDRLGLSPGKKQVEYVLSISSLVMSSLSDRTSRREIVPQSGIAGMSLLYAPCYLSFIGVLNRYSNPHTLRSAFGLEIDVPQICRLLPRKNLVILMRHFASIKQIPSPNQIGDDIG